MCHEGSVDCVTKLVLLHAVQDRGKSWKTHHKRYWKVMENHPRCSVPLVHKLCRPRATNRILKTYGDHTTIKIEIVAVL